MAISPAPKCGFFVQLPKDHGEKTAPHFFEGTICLGSLWLGEFFASAILSRYLGKLWVVGKPLCLGFMSQRFLSILFEEVIDKWLTRFPDVVRITLGRLLVVLLRLFFSWLTLHKEISHWRYRQRACVPGAFPAGWLFLSSLVSASRVSPCRTLPRFSVTLN